MQIPSNGPVGLLNPIVVTARAFLGRPAQQIPPLIGRVGQRNCAARTNATVNEKEDPQLNSFRQATWIASVIPPSSPAPLDTWQSEHRLPYAPGFAIAVIRGRLSG